MKSFAFGSRELDSQYYGTFSRFSFTKSSRGRFNKEALTNGSFTIYSVGTHPIQKLLRENDIRDTEIATKFFIDAKDEKSAVWLKMCWENVVVPAKKPIGQLSLAGVYNFNYDALMEKFSERKGIIASKNYCTSLTNLVRAAEQVNRDRQQHGFEANTDVATAIQTILDRMPERTCDAAYDKAYKRLQKVEGEIKQMIQKMRMC